VTNLHKTLANQSRGATVAGFAAQLSKGQEKGGDHRIRRPGQEPRLSWAGDKTIWGAGKWKKEEDVVDVSRNSRSATRGTVGSKKKGKSVAKVRRQIPPVKMNRAKGGSLGLERTKEKREPFKKV